MTGEADRERDRTSRNAHQGIHAMAEGKADVGGWLRRKARSAAEVGSSDRASRSFNLARTNEDFTGDRGERRLGETLCRLKWASRKCLSSKEANGTPDRADGGKV